MSNGKDPNAAENSSEMTLKASLDECMEALDLFLNNHFNESLERLRPRVQESMYHALIYATVLEMQAMMTFQHDDITNAGDTMKSAQEVCQRFRRKSQGLANKSVGESLSEGKRCRNSQLSHVTEEESESSEMNDINTSILNLFQSPSLFFRQVPTLKQKIAGKSPPTEKFAIRKARRYKSPNPVRLPVPVLEMMYMWNGFSMISKRPELTEGMMQTLVEAERTLLESPEHEYLVDDRCLIHMLKGLCFKNQGILQAAEECFNKVCSSEKKIKFDHYLVPNALVELSLLYIDQGRRDAAIKILHKVKHNYKDYSMESRTLFRIHAALAKLKANPEEEDSQM
ncbi:tetratricopeptide repeat protein 39A [Gambusia affinis]|uniref:tetratricopeptide repeat protein 39A n=1 Tax=Gambusia affinis TaxID=33528 RepID=UPI001CDBECE6|nr:tetratricopeptide repeat protein 39A [Gambusia affinis]